MDSSYSDDDTQHLPPSIIINPLHADNHDIFSIDPRPLQALIGRVVDIRTNTNTLHTGRVYTIDPISFSFILVDTASNRPQIIMGHSIKHVSLSTHDEGVKTGENKGEWATGVLGKEEEVITDFSQRGVEVEEWLRKNRVPVSRRENILSVMDVVEIGPPYTSEACRGTNQIILGRIQDLVDKMGQFKGGVAEEV